MFFALKTLVDDPPTRASPNLASVLGGWTPITFFHNVLRGLEEPLRFHGNDMSVEDYTIPLKLKANQASGAIITTIHTAYNFSESNAPFFDNKFPDFFPWKKMNAADDGHRTAWPIWNNNAKKKRRLLSSNHEVMLSKTMREKNDPPNPRQIGINSPYQ